MRPEIYQNLERHLKPLGIADFEVYFERTVSREIEAKDQAVEVSQGAVEAGLALRVFKQGRVGFGYSTELSEAGLLHLAETVAAVLPWVDPDPDQTLPGPARIPANLELRVFDPKLSEVTDARKRELALSLEAAARDFDPGIKHVRSACYDEQTTEVSLRNSAGLELSFRRTRCRLGVMAVAEIGGEAESGYEFESSPGFEGLDPKRVGQAAAALALSYLGATTVGSRRVPILLDPLVAGEILEVLAGSFQGDAVFKKRSFLENKRGQKIYSPDLNILDDGLLPGGEATCPFDGEGQPGRCLPLVEQGVVANFLLDRLYGKKLGLAANGSAVRRGLQRPPMISYLNLRIPPGEFSDESLFREIGSGIFVTETIGMHAANPVTGDFSVGIQGFLIEGGEKRGAVKKLALAGNLHQMMADIRAIGSRHRSHGRVGAPTLAIQEMAVGGG